MVLTLGRYVDAMERDHATRVLEAYRDGTFLVRKSNNPKRRGDHALSIKYVVRAKSIAFVK